MSGQTSSFESFNTLAHSRHSTRIFTQQQIPDEDIKKILKIAGTAPYASGRKNWGVTVVKDRAIILKAVNLIDKTSSKLVKEMRDEFAGNFESYSGNFSNFKTAPVLLVPWFRISPAISIMCKSPSTNIAEWERDTLVKSISCVIMLIHLAAESLGLSSCINTGALIAESELVKLFKIKNGRNIGAIIPVGYEGTKNVND